MKTFKIFSTAALALMMAACSSEDAALNNSPAQQQGRKVHFTATIAAPGGNAGTRTEYTEVTEGETAGTINVAWKAKDEIALIHNGTKDVVTVETVNEDGSATITGDITVGTDGEAVIAYYPAAAIELNNDKNPVPAAAYTANLLAQDGTLSYIASNLDLRVGESTLAVDGDKATLASSVSLTSNTAIWKLTLQDNAATPAALAATKVTIKSGSDELASTTELSPGASTVYLAVPAATGDICITATTADNDYFYMKEGVALEAKKYYQSTVQMTKGAHLAFLSADYEAKDGAILTGTLDGAHKISIADGATVTLDNATIEGINSDWYQYAGITCLGDATIILKEGTTNTVNGFDGHFPGIQGAAGKTLTITGSGTLNAKSYGTGAGIGSGYGSERACGNIIIEGGTITATGGNRGAGIGSGDFGTCGAITISGGTVTATGGAYGAGIGSSLGEGNQSSTGKCGDILISGGTVSATGGQFAAAIGSGDEGSCGNITITTGVTQVTATRDGGLETVGRGGNGSCTSVSIGGTVYWNGSAYQNGGDTYLTQSTIVYPSPFANVTASDLGKVIGADGKIYADATAASAASTTAVAMIAYVGNDAETSPTNTAFKNGLALALSDVSSTKSWCSQKSATCLGTQYDNSTKFNDLAGIANTDALVNHTGHTHAAASAARDYNSGTHPTGTSVWFLPSAGQWNKMIGSTGLGLSNLGLQKSAYYWSSSERNANDAWLFTSLGDWGSGHKDNVIQVRACLAF